MSQPETNEIINPTNTFSLPLQTITEEINSVTTQLANTTVIPSAKIMINPTNVQMNPALFAAKQKLFAHISFAVTHTVGQEIYTQPVTPMFLEQFFSQPNAFAVRNFDIEILFKPTNNSMFQGFHRTVFDPAPSAVYYALFGNSLSVANAFQLPGINITGASADVSRIFLPKIYPFNYFFNHFSEDVTDRDYMRSYPMGRLRTIVVTQLQTTSTLVEMPTQLSLALPNFTYGGTRLGT